MPDQAEKARPTAEKRAEFGVFGVARVLHVGSNFVRRSGAAVSTISNYLPPSLTSYLNGTSTGQTSTSTSSANQGSAASATGATGSGDSAATVSLSDEAKAFLAAAGGGTQNAAASAPTQASVRSWFDEQYKKLGITTPTPQGKPALDLSGQSRAALSIVVSNADKKFSDAEQKAAEGELAKRFDDAITPHIAIARKTGNYAALYQAAADYLDQAGPEERAVKSWQDDRRAVIDGLAAAKATKGQAPETDPTKDPVRALLDQRAAKAISASADAAAVAANARAMLDDQANAASDAGTVLAFGPRESGRPVDFTKFNNRALAAIAVNKDDTFSGEQARAAKNELNLRTRTTMLNVLSPTSGSAAGADINLGLIRTYENMSEEEKSALGVTDAVTDRLIQNFSMLQQLQSAFAGGGGSGSTGMFGLSAAMAAYNQASSKENMNALGLGGLL